MKMTKTIIKKGADATPNGGTKFWIQTSDKRFYSSFKADVGAAIEGIRDGDTVEFEIEEKHGKDREGNPKVYQNISSIIGIQQGNGASSSPAPEKEPEDGVSYTKKQVLIVRQNSITNAVAAIQGRAVEDDKLVASVLKIAGDFESWVWRED